MGGMENTKLIKPVEAILKKGSDDELSSIIKSQKDSRFIVKKPFIINKNTYR